MLGLGDARKNIKFTEECLYYWVSWINHDSSVVCWQGSQFHIIQVKHLTCCSLHLTRILIQRKLLPFPLMQPKYRLCADFRRFNVTQKTFFCYSSSNWNILNGWALAVEYLQHVYDISNTLICLSMTEHFQFKWLRAKEGYHSSAFSALQYLVVKIFLHTLINVIVSCCLNITETGQEILHNVSDYFSHANWE